MVRPEKGDPNAVFTKGTCWSPSWFIVLPRECVTCVRKARYLGACFWAQRHRVVFFFPLFAVEMAFVSGRASTHRRDRTRWMAQEDNGHSCQWCNAPRRKEANSERDARQDGCFPPGKKSHRHRQHGWAVGRGRIWCSRSRIKQSREHGGGTPGWKARATVNGERPTQR